MLGMHGMGEGDANNCVLFTGHCKQCGCMDLLESTAFLSLD